ncbi:hypothetical protein D477_007898 [Arthrobacter crystallopoietes BAB-32]|uniref:Uncharacterized protein n=1 Tax=Arthrobacter crystallopoietes BAB-32 TaxID=1246476 RepID=N1V930_9MICC|nr:hypothetical protein [Arthrobacter crystallopoietes]EMY34758.1 hypothetical protein D477_007898 [Arthrobacter crystallopoietes BAB-32]
MSKRGTRAGAALVTVLLGWLLTGYPAVLMFFVAVFSFSGCLLECTEPDPVAGTLAAIAASALVAAPLLIAYSVLRPKSHAWKFGVAAVAALALVGLYGVLAGAF